MPDPQKADKIILAIDLSGSMTEGAKLRVVMNLLKSALLMLELGLRESPVLNLRIAYITEKENVEDFQLDESYEIPPPSCSGGCFNQEAFSDYLSQHLDSQSFCFLFTDTVCDFSEINNLFTVLVGNEVPPERFGENTYSTDHFLPLWQSLMEYRGGNR